MGKKTINQALKDLFLGLGGDVSALADNTSVSDYIEDLESAISGAASGVINDTEASEVSTYSSSKLETLIPALPTPSAANNGKVVGVNYAGKYALLTPVGVDSSSVSFIKEGGSWSCTKTTSDIDDLLTNKKIVQAYVREDAAGPLATSYIASLVSYERYYEGSTPRVRYDFMYISYSNTTPTIHLLSLDASGVTESTIS